MSLICQDCLGLLPLKRELAVLQFKLPKRCVPCAEKATEKPRPENVNGVSKGGDYDSSDEHFWDRQGIL